MIAALEGGEWSAARPGRILPPGKTRYPFYRRLGGPQGWCGRAENLVPTGIRSRTVPSGPESSRKLRFPDFIRTAQDGGKVVSLTHRPSLSPKKCTWYSFLLETEATPGPYYDRKDFMRMKFFNDTSWDRTSHLQICSTAP